MITGIHIRERLLILAMLAAVAVAPGTVKAGAIQADDIVEIPGNVTGSGNGTLDLRLFTFSGSEISNAAGAFNGDNGNSALPQGGGADTSAFAESYITTAGELKAYYNLNFAPGAINEIVLFLDLNETTGASQLNNTLAKLDIVLNPSGIQGNPDPLSDVSSAGQAAIDQVYSAGATMAYLDPQPAANLPVNSQGAGFADYAIFTGVNPFDLADGDVILFNVSMSVLSNGAEEIFLSGTYAPPDVPEPATMSLLALGGLALTRRRTV